eukprot:gnl/Dysnectes_brevis/7079_a11540_371.p1 GENE.gnl/Dysnectes_brevis/7079_a11540_371~~gnl/Dysnectes_brevis/7079_a11540_371.p1  ORF type:complete len:202 (+),score=58.08 gnl/Dysnectes_brevis/7079_a11540_371:45-650(+)
MVYRGVRKNRPLLKWEEFSATFLIDTHDYDFQTLPPEEIFRSFYSQESIDIFNEWFRANTSTHTLPLLNFLILTTEFTLLPEYELTSIFKVFDHRMQNALDITQCFLAVSMLLSRCIGVRSLFLFQHNAVIIEQLSDDDRIPMAKAMTFLMAVGIDAVHALPEVAEQLDIDGAAEYIDVEIFQVLCFALFSRQDRSSQSLR